MENIRQALERARGLKIEDPGQRAPIAPFAARVSLGAGNFADATDVPAREVALNTTILESNRIIAHNETDARSRSFDMLRTQVLQSMDKKNWRFVGITSPTPGCGKTVTAINLAFSIARQPERSALLLDLDLQKPRVSASLGLNCENGVVAVLEGKANLPGAIIQAQAGACSILVLPGENSAPDSSAWMTSRPLSAMLQDIRQRYSAHTVIIDLPPMLIGDDVIAVLPQLDCILLVAAVGKSKVSEIEECNKHLRSTEVVRLVLNKVPTLDASYYGSY